MYRVSLGARIFVGGLLASLVLLPARAQQTPPTDAESPDRLWSRYQNDPNTKVGQKAGRNALRRWATAPNPTRLRAAAKNLDPGSALWPDLVQALTEAYRTSNHPPAYREGYKALLQNVKERITHPEGWLAAMIALGDYYRTVENDRWAATTVYEEAHRQGGNQRLIRVLEERLEDVRSRDVGETAPPFQVTTMDGSAFNLEALRGDPVVLYFWARWCSPCLRTLPKLNNLQQRYEGTDLHVLGLITDVTDRQKLRTYLEEEGITWPQAITEDWQKEGRSPARLYGGSSERALLGRLVVIDRRGRIAAYGNDYEPVRDTLRSIMAE